jgi:hypothetical protein
MIGIAFTAPEFAVSMETPAAKATRKSSAQSRLFVIELHKEKIQYERSASVIMMKKDRLSLDQAWSNWFSCLNGNDTNSIFEQISLMIWDTAIFRLIVESRQIQIEKNPRAPQVNGSLHSFIDRNYFQTQAD